jgi:CSLREA domain-containing protein
MRTESLRVVVNLVLGMATVARAATITVNSTADAVVNDGNCTLREAILAANSDTAVDACPAGSGPDVVAMPAGTYPLTGPLGGAGEDAGLTGDLDITDDLELVGAGADATVILAPFSCLGFLCARADRVLDVDPAGVGISVRVSGVTLGGSPPPFAFGRLSLVDEGGVIRNRGTLVVADSVVADIELVSTSPVVKRGGGIFSVGPLRIERSVIRDNSAGNPFSQTTRSAGLGGGISALGPLEVIDSTVAGNRAVSSDAPEPGRGGGISAAGPVTLVRSTVSGNTAGPSAMSILGTPGIGGGLAVENATIVNSTISGNTGGGILVGGALDLSNVTITANPGGGLTADSAVLRNTIVAGNAPVDCVVASTTGDAYNIDGDGSCGLSGTDQPAVAPLLGPLADNGGATFTHAPLPDSPASGMGSPAAPGSGGTACEATDQRGITRPVGGRCDVGAFEGADPATSFAPCSSEPRPGCQLALGERSKLQLRSVAADHTKDKSSWSWVGSTPVPIGDFADPAGGATGYSLCLYDHDRLRRAERAPAGGTCGKTPCWRAAASGFVYTDPLLEPNGIKKIVLMAGTSAGKARITVKGKGANLGLPALPLSIPVRMQLLRSGAPTCWEATFTAPRRNDAAGFDARSVPSRHRKTLGLRAVSAAAPNRRWGPIEDSADRGFSDIPPPRSAIARCEDGVNKLVVKDVACAIAAR